MDPNARLLGEFKYIVRNYWAADGTTLDHIEVDLPGAPVGEHRVDCGVCGALAVFLILDDEHDSQPDAVHTGESDWGYSAWCQACWEHAQEPEGGMRR